MNTTKIEWCDATINPVVGCSKCSPGCDNCYAERIAARMAKHPNPKVSGKYAGVVDDMGKWNGKTTIAFDGWEASDHLQDWMLAVLPKKPSRIFVGSMCDVFHESIEQEWLESIWEVMRRSPQHIFMLLTKREKQLYEWAHVLQPLPNPLPNVWLGVTVCNQAEADEKIPVLLRTPAAKRFVSVEPMLGPVEIGKYLYGSYECALSCGTRLPCTALPEKRCTACGFTGPDDYETWGEGPSEECPKCHKDGGCGEIEDICPDCGTYMVQEHPDTLCIDWVICGGETGPNARPMHPDWVRSLRDQCKASGVPFFFKGWGEYLPLIEASNPRPYDSLPDHLKTGRYTHPLKLNWVTLQGYDFCNNPWRELSSDWWQRDREEGEWWMFKAGKKRSGRLLDDREWSEVPV